MLFSVFDYFNPFFFYFKNNNSNEKIGYFDILRHITNIYNKYFKIKVIKKSRFNDVF